MTDIRTSADIKNQFMGKPNVDVRPPALYSTRGGGNTFKWSGLTKEYYGAMRFLGYAASPIADIYNDKFKAEVKAEREAYMAKCRESDQQPDWHVIDAFDKREPKFNKKKISQIEGIVFGLTTLLYAWRDWKDMVRCFGDSIGAEQGKSASQTRSADLWNSNNPIIQTALKRFMYMNVTRLAADSAFFKNLNIGILAQAVRVTAERTLFSQKTAYDRLEKLFIDSQLYNFDAHATGKIAKELGNVIQQVQKDHDRQAWRSEVIEHYNPLFQAMADATANKRIGINETVFILGELMTKRLSLDESQKLLDDVVQYSLGGLRQRPKEVKILNQSKEIAAEGAMLQEVNDRQIENTPKTMSKSNFAEKFMNHNILSKSALEHGQRSFSEMAEQSSEGVVRGA